MSQNILIIAYGNSEALISNLKTAVVRAERYGLPQRRVVRDLCPLPTDLRRLDNFLVSEVRKDVQHYFLRQLFDRLNIKESVNVSGETIG